MKSKYLKLITVIVLQGFLTGEIVLPAAVPYDLSSLRRERATDIETVLVSDGVKRIRRILEELKQKQIVYCLKCGGDTCNTAKRFKELIALGIIKIDDGTIELSKKDIPLLEELVSFAEESSDNQETKEIQELKEEIKNFVDGFCHYLSKDILSRKLQKIQVKWGNEFNYRIQKSFGKVEAGSSVLNTRRWENILTRTKRGSSLLNWPGVEIYIYALIDEIHWQLADKKSQEYQMSDEQKRAYLRKLTESNQLKDMAVREWPYLPNYRFADVVKNYIRWLLDSSESADSAVIPMETGIYKFAPDLSKQSFGTFMSEVEGDSSFLSAQSSAVTYYSSKEIAEKTDTFVSAVRSKVPEDVKEKLTQIIKRIPKETGLFEFIEDAEIQVVVYRDNKTGNYSFYYFDRHSPQSEHVFGAGGFRSLEGVLSSMIAHTTFWSALTRRSAFLTEFWKKCLMPISHGSSRDIYHLESLFVSQFSYYLQGKEIVPRGYKLSLKRFFEKYIKPYRKTDEIDITLLAAVNEGVVYSLKSSKPLSALLIEKEPKNDEIDSGLSEPARRYNSLLKKGVALFKEGKDNEAIALWQEAINLGLDNTDAVINLGIAYQKAGRDREALSCYKDVVEIMEGHYDAWYNIATVFAKYGEKRKMLQALENAIMFDPGMREDAKKDSDFKAYWDEEDFPDCDYDSDEDFLGTDWIELPSGLYERANKLLETSI